MTEWRAIPGWESLYEVSEDGRVRRIGGRELHASLTPTGYQRVALSDGARRQGSGVHRYVALAFVENPLSLPTVNHKDGVKSNNHYSNLEWMTIEQNRAHAGELGLSAPVKLSDEIVEYCRSVFKKNHRVFGGAALARQFGVDTAVMHNAIRGTTWARVPDARELSIEPPRPRRKSYSSEHYARRASSQRDWWRNMSDDERADHIRRVVAGQKKHRAEQTGET